MALRVFEFLSISIFLILLVTQIILPIINAQKTWPMFRRRNEVAKKLIDLNEAEDIKASEKEIAKREERLKK
jgi:hypothetical protein